MIKIISLLLLVTILCVLTSYVIGQAKHPPALPIAAPPLVSSIGVGGEGIELTSGVIQKGKKFGYSYCIKNTGKEKTCLVCSSLPDKGMGLNNDVRDRYHYYLLKPGETVKISFLHDNPPIESKGNITCFIAGKREEDGLSIECRKAFKFSMSGMVVGYVPKEK